MSLPTWALPFKEPRTEIRCIKGRYYKYQVRYQYEKERKRTAKKTVCLLGKITEQDGFIPSNKNALRQQAKTVPKVDIKTFGLYGLFKLLLSEEIPLLQHVFGKKTAERLLVFALARWAYQSPIKRIEQYHAHDFCSEDWSADQALHDKLIHQTLKETGERREDILAWLRLLLPEKAAEAAQFIMMDSTHVMSASEHLAINQRGYNNAADFGKQLRLMYLFSAQLKRPVYYRLIQGNIPDISSMALCIKEMSVSNAVYIADKGFYSRANKALLDKAGLQYIIPLRRDNQAIDYAPLESGDFKKSHEYFIYQGRIIWYYQYESAEGRLVTFLDERLRVEEEQDYLGRTVTHPESYSREGYEQRLPRFGTLTLMSKTGDTYSPEQLYSIYKQRNEIEVMFDSYKTFLESDRQYMQNRHVLEGWLFANFIAMIGYYKLYNRLREAKLLGKHSPRDIIEMSKTIYKLKINGEWTLAEVPERVRKLLGKLNIDYLK